MYSRRNSPNGVLRLVAGLIIVFIAIAAFSIYQAQHTASQPTTPPPILPTNTPIPVALAPTLKPSPSPVQLRLVVAKVNVSALIIQVYLAKSQDNWDLTQLSTYAGHLEGTDNLNQGGNFVLAGHVEMHDGSAGPFAQIAQLSRGDRITIVSDKPGDPVVMRYSVTTVETVQPNDFNVLRNHGYEELTLITCGDWNEATQQYLTRVVVHARPVV
jgi:LPXTG-site transpeptidase (sortase) family protein